LGKYLRKVKVHMIVISTDHLVSIITSAQFLDNVIRYSAIVGIILSVLSNICSALANFIPEPQEEEIGKKIAKVSKIVNFIAINAKKFKVIK